MFQKNWRYLNKMAFTPNKGKKVKKSKWKIEMENTIDFMTFRKLSLENNSVFLAIHLNH